MVNKAIFIYLIIFFSLILTGCHNFRLQSNSQYSNSNKSLACVREENNLNEFNPIVLYKVMVSCIKNNLYEKGIFLYLLAGSYTYYDANRINTFYARKVHHNLLAENLAFLTKAEYNSFWSNLKDFMEQDKQRKMVCVKIEQVGAPNYHPSYMLKNKVSNVSQYGVDYILFKKSVNSYLNC